MSVCMIFIVYRKGHQFRQDEGEAPDTERDW
jgi:hypothetical protein